MMRKEKLSNQYKTSEYNQNNLKIILTQIIIRDSVLKVVYKGVRSSL